MLLLLLFGRGVKSVAAAYWVVIVALRSPWKKEEMKKKGNSSAHVSSSSFSWANVSRKRKRSRKIIPLFF